MDRTPDYPAPPLPGADTPKWIGLRKAAEEWARGSDRDEKYYFDLMLRSFWLGDFERDGNAKLFTFEVPEAYAKIHKKSEVEGRLGPRLSSYTRADEHAVALDEVGWVLNPQQDSQYLPIVVQEEAIDTVDGSRLMIMTPQYHLDQSGELWITTVDNTGKSYSVVSQYRDIRYYDRSSLIRMLVSIRDIQVDGVFLNDNSTSMQIAESIYDALAKKPLDTYSLRGEAILSRLHIYMTDLADWARQKRLPCPFEVKISNGIAETRGRPPRSGSYAVDDEPLVEEMHQALEQQRVRSVSAAAEIVVDHAAGGGTKESKSKRLVGRYRQKYSEIQR